MPCGGHNSCLAFGADGAEEVDRLMMGVCQADWHYHVSGTDVESGSYQAGDVKLFESHLAPFLYFRLIFAVLVAFKFYGCASPSGLELDFCPENPFWGEFIVESYGKPGIAIVLR